MFERVEVHFEEEKVRGLTTMTEALKYRKRPKGEVWSMTSREKNTMGSW